MTRRNRVKTALALKPPDYTPGNIELCAPTMAAFTKKYGVKPAEFFNFAGNHFEKISYNGGSAKEPHFFVDEFGVTWNRAGGDDIGVVDKYLLSEPDLKGFKFPKVGTADIKARTEKVLNNGRDAFKAGKIGMLLFERAWSLRSMEELLVDFYENEEFADELFTKITDYNLLIIKEALKYPVDGFYFGDDYGQQTGLIMGAALWRRFIKPHLARTFAPIKKKGLPVVLHSCGNIYDILGDLKEIGLDCYQTVQPEVYDFARLKKDFRLAFFGGISTQQFLPYAKPGEVKAKIKETCGVLGKGGGYICAPTHQVPADVPPENIMAMIEALKK